MPLRGELRAGRRPSLARVAVFSCLTLLIAATAAASDSRPRPKPSVDELKALLLNAAQTERARIRAADLLGALDDPRAEAALIEALSDTKEPVRFGAARALGRSGRAAAVQPLLKLLGSPDEPRLVRGAAALSLGDIGDARAVTALVATRRDAAAEMRVAARQALLRLPPATVPLSRVDLLSEILTDREGPEPARAEAARMLGESRDPRSIPLLVGVLGTPGPPDRPVATFTDFVQARAEAKNSLPASAARALGELGAKEAVPALIQAARKPESEVRIAALEALARLRAPEAIPVAVDALVDREPRARRWATFLLSELEARDVLAQLRSVLADSDDGVRLHATRALVRMNDVAAVDQLVEALSREQVPHVRSALQDALAALAPVAPW